MQGARCQQDNPAHVRSFLGWRARLTLAGGSSDTPEHFVENTLTSIKL